MSGTDDRLALDVALGDHHLLSDEDLGGGDFDTKITTGDHNTVSLLENLVEVVDTLLVLNLGDDLNLLTLFTQHVTNVADVTSPTNERGKDHVDAVLDTELEITDILLGKGGKVNIGAGQVNTLARGDVTIVKTLDAQGLVVNDLQNLEGEDTIVDIDELSGSDHIGNVLIVQVPNNYLVSLNKPGFLPSHSRIGLENRYEDSHVLVVASISVLLISGDVELVTLLDGDILIIGSVSSTDFRSFLQCLLVLFNPEKAPVQTYGIKSNGEGTSGLDSGGLTGVVDNGLVVLW